MSKFKVGDKVTRKLYLDNGTWARRGDDCLKHSPVLHGVVMEIRNDGHRDINVVNFDDGLVANFLDHGIDKEGLDET